LASWLKGKGFKKETQDWVVKENVVGSTFSMWTFEILRTVIPQGDAMSWQIIAGPAKPRKFATGGQSQRTRS